MNITNKTVLITGGGSGIGLEIAKLLNEKNNRVVITGRNEAKLQNAAAGLSNVTVIASDITDAASADKLIAEVKATFGTLDILINNAGQAYVYTLDAAADSVEKSRAEFDTNFFSVLNLTEKLLPAILQSAEGAIVNVSSVLAIVPRSTLPTYSASKAALHSYTQSLRLELAKTNIKVFELMPPLVNTEFSKDIGGENGIAPEVVAHDLINAFENDEYEIHVGNTAYIHGLSLSAPAEAFDTING